MTFQSVADALFNPPKTAPPWGRVLASVLPLWFFCLAIMVEGFPRAPFSIIVAYIWAGLALALSALFLSLRWMPFSVFLYSVVVPYAIMGTFDEITTTYKTPLIATFAVIFALGSVLSQRWKTVFPRWLLFGGIGMLLVMLAGLVAGNYWRLVTDWGFYHCFPDAAGCPPLPADAPPWWMLFFRFS